MATPGMPTENDLQGEVFDDCYDSNRDRLHELQDRAIRFMRDEGHENASSDFQYFYKNLQQEHVLPSDALPSLFGNAIDTETLLAQFAAVGKSTWERH